ncbi:hypothetical protein ACSB4A_002438 [Enterobacter hormaechei]
MSTTLKEWLVKTIAELEEERDSMPGVVNVDADMALAAMKLALASLEAKPVVFRSKLKPPSAIGSENWDYTDHRQPDAFELESCVIERLYTAPPAPVSVPDVVSWEDVPEEITEDDIALASAWAHGFNQCRTAMLQGADGKPELTVWYGAMPETNGKTNWTAMLHRKGHHPWEGITIDRSEYPGRVRYEADRMRHLIGELADEPDILAYDSDAHSGYVEPVTTAYKLRDAVEIIRNSGIEIDAEKIFAERDALNTPDCWCRTCRPVTVTDMRFVVCPDCGNKRCPHANDHRNACTGSNEPGQDGSAYPAAPQQEKS